MTAQTLLDRLEAVRSRGSGKWSARCPAHADKTPSLSVCEGEHAILLKCWAGCDLAAICTALGLTISNLFFDSELDPSVVRRQRAQRDRERRRKARLDAAAECTIDALRETEYFIRSRQGLDISTWSQAQLHTELIALGVA